MISLFPNKFTKDQVKAYRLEIIFQGRMEEKHLGLQSNLQVIVDLKGLQSFFQTKIFFKHQWHLYPKLAQGYPSWDFHKAAKYLVCPRIVLCFAYEWCLKMSGWNFPSKCEARPDPTTDKCCYANTMLRTKWVWMLLDLYILQLATVPTTPYCLTLSLLPTSTQYKIIVIT